jgi:multimeric flavodoxin WrbA
MNDRFGDKSEMGAMGSKQMNVLAIVGSPRLNGNTNYLVDQALQEAMKLGAQTEKIVLSEYKISPCLGHQNCSEFDSCLQKDDGMLILRKFCEADGLILATPVYYFDVTAWMKIFIDRNCFLFQHGIKAKSRAVGMIVVAGSAGIEAALRTLNMLVTASITSLAKERRFIVTGYATGPGDVKNNSSLVDEAINLGRKITQSLRE